MELDKPYNRGEFIAFLNTFLPEDYEPNPSGEDVEVSKGLIQKAVFLGAVHSLDNLRVYEIHHQSEYDPRVTITKEICRLMANHGVRKAIAVFTSKKSDNYRLSLITIDVNLAGRRTVREYSNPRRYSFYLGPDAKINTPSRALKERIVNIVDLERRFSIEVVNKEFYSNIAKYFNQLVGGKVFEGARRVDYSNKLKMPIDYGKARAKYQEFAVRLIGRIIFCWFLKHKKSVSGLSLLPDELFSSKAVEANNNYYHSVLEVLFFEVLNTLLKNRKNGTEAFCAVPFLNGGLFAPHVDDHYFGKPLYCLTIPDKWFKDLFLMLEQYNFTIDENSSIDVDISVDPEMLGRIFENLIAEINPETGETARKATGSYYTPRPIVEYMVDQGLKQYLHNETRISEERLLLFLSYADNGISITEAEADLILNALDKIKIIDPACGSGAFPMGILHKMLLVLQKVDPESKKWFRKKLDKIENEIIRKEAEEKLKDENWNYIHKLGIVQDSIFGVDIQPIAVEISKLRFFLSLIVDENINDQKLNRGIKPLPNLEFKFVAANSMIGLPKRQHDKVLKEVGNLFESEDDIKKLKKLREVYLQSYGEDKKNIENEFKKGQAEMFKKGSEWKASESKTIKLAEWDPFSSEAANWFDPEWMFGVKNGFNIVIANPPYGAKIDKNKVKAIKCEMKDTENMNSAAIFIDRAKNKYLAKDGVLAFIVPKSLLYSERWFPLVESLLGRVKALIDVEKAFSNVLLEQVVFVYSGSINVSKYLAIKFKEDKFAKTIFISNDLARKIEAWICDVTDEEIDILQKVLSSNIVYMKDISDTKRGMGLQKQLSKTGDCPIIGGKNIFRYGIDGVKGYLSIEAIKNKTKKLSFIRQKKIVSQDVIAHIQNPAPHIKIMSYLDEDGHIYGLDTVQNTVIIDNKYDYRYILAILNSSFVSWYTYKFIYCSAIRTMHLDKYYIGKIPIPIPPVNKQIQIIKIVKTIEAMTSSDDYLKNNEKKARVSRYDKLIDEIVYGLYGLSEEEIGILEKKNVKA